MTRHSFTAQELFCMALLQRKRQMYGIPTGVEEMPKEKAWECLQQVQKSLIAENIVKMDFVNQPSLQHDYDELLRFICDCEKCMELKSQRNNRSQNFIFWKLENEFMMAEVIGAKFLFSKTSPDQIRAMTADMWSEEAYHKQEKEIEIRQMAMKKAKRLTLEGNKEEAIRLLRQNGADEGTAWLITDGFEEKADFLAILLMTVEKDSGSEKEAFFIATGARVFEVSQSVINLRTCTKLSGVDGKEPQKALSETLEMFFKN